MFTLSGDDDYEDLSGGRRAVAIYDYLGGEQAAGLSTHLSTFLLDPKILFSALRGRRRDLLQPG